MPADKPLVSIGIPVYNGAKYVIDTLNSIHYQTYPNIEICIVDDGSSDNSYDLCKHWAAQCRYIISVQKNNNNLGVTRTSNIILNYCTGKYFQLFGQDDILLPGKIEHDVEIFEKLDKGVALIYSKMKLIDEAGNFLEQDYNERIRFDGICEADVFAELIKWNFIPAPTVILRMDIVKAAGGYDELLIFEDWDLWLRLAMNYNFFFADVTNVYYRIHSESTMAKKEIGQQILRNTATIRMIKKQRGVNDKFDRIIQDKIRELSVYSFFLGDENAEQNLRGSLMDGFDIKVWIYHKLAQAGFKHPSKFLKFSYRN